MTNLPKKGDEKRREHRIPVRIPVSMSTIETFLDSEIMNLSKGGIFVKADITFPLGTEIELEFTLPRTKKPIQATGVVVWSRTKGGEKSASFPEHEPGMGIQFKDIKMKELEILLDEIERLMEKEHKPK